MTIPSNYRQLKPDETVRKGDLYRQEDGQVFSVRNSMGRMVGGYPTNLYTFWRRRHTKKTPVVVQLKSAKDVIKQQAKNVTVVSFSYPNSKTNVQRLRTVQLISLDDTYLIGLEVTGDRPGEYKFQFKRYLRWKIRGISLVHFGAPLQ